MRVLFGDVRERETGATDQARFSEEGFVVRGEFERGFKVTAVERGRRGRSR